jgi:hypothetical protein
MDFQRRFLMSLRTPNSIKLASAWRQGRTLAAIFLFKDIVSGQYIGLMEVAIPQAQ